MIDKYYNPYDIYKNEDVKKHLQSIINKISPKPFSMEDQIVTSTFSYLTGVTNFLGMGFAKILEIGTNYNFQQLQREQIIYLEKHPEDLRRELRVNLIISILHLRYIFKIKKNTGQIRCVAKIIWKSIKKLSFQEGLMEDMIEFFEKNRNEKWLVLRSPIALLMNSYYQNKNISLVHIDSYLSDLVRAGENTSDIDDLCCHEFQSGFLYGTIRNYLENQFDEIIAHSKTYKEAFPQLVKMMERCLTWRDLIVTDLKKNELSTYEYYRKKIEQWTKDYPAKENTNNYRLVINTLHNCTKVAKQDLRLNTNLVRDIKLNKEQQKQICEEFNKRKNFMIHSIYIEKFETIAEMISFWNAFDNSDPLDMNP